MKNWTCSRRLLAAIAAGIAGLAATTASGQVVISQYWGGGSTTGAAPADTVELFNIGTSPVNLAGWSIQVATATGTAWTRIPITAGTIPGKGYFLVRIASGTGTANGTAYDAVSTAADILLSSSGKIALVDSSNSATLTGAAPIGTTGTYPPSATAGIVDFVGYGTTAGSRENTTLPGATANNAPAGSFTGPTAGVRRGTRCSDNGTTPDTNVNSADFVTVTPIVWRNSSTAALGNNFATVAATPTTPIAAGGSLTISGSAKQCAAGSPNLVATSATVDLSAIGLSASSTLTSGDGGLTWSGTFTIPGTAAPATYSPVVTFVTGSGNLTASASFSVLPGNDECAQALAATGAPYAFTGTGFTVSGNTALATTSTGTALGTCGLLNNGTSTNPTVKNDLYYKFTPDVSSNYNLNLCGSSTNWDSVLSVHSGCAASAANQLSCNDDGVCSAVVGLSAITNLPLTAGTPYIVRVMTYTSGTASPFVLTVSGEPLGTCCSADGSTCTLAVASSCPSPSVHTPGNTCGANPCPIPAPANDDCATAVVIPSVPYTSPAPIQIGGALADQDISCNSTTATGTNNGVWFTYTATSACSLSITRTASGGTGDTSAAIFTGTCAGLTEVGCADAETISFTTSAGTQYFILVGAFSGTPITASTTLSISADCVPLPPAPANDLCSGAIAVSAIPFTSSAIAVAGATTDANLSCNTGGATAVNNGIWFSYTPTANCSLRVSETGTLNAIIGVYTGSCGTLSEVACSAADAAPAFAATAGTPYFILVGVEGLGSAGVADTLVVSVDCTQPPSNDDCGGALVVSSVPYTSPTINVTNANSDADVSCNSTAATVANNGVWFTYTPSANGTLSLNNTTGPDTFTAIFTGSCGSLSEVACSDPSAFTYPGASAGTQYYILVGAWSSAALTTNPTNLVFTLNLVNPPANDDCTGAQVIASVPYNAALAPVDASLATDDVGILTDPSCNAASATVGKGIWFTYTPTANGQLQMREQGSLDSVQAIFSGTCGGLTQLGCSDGTPVTGDEFFLWPVVAGTQYYILVGDWGTPPAPASVSITFALDLLIAPPAPSNDTCSGATLISSLPYTSGNVPNGGATDDQNATCNGTGSTLNGIWYTYTPTTNCNFIMSETTSQDAIFAVFIGDCSFPLEAYCTLSDADTGAFSASAGTQYFILVGKQGTTAAGFTENLNITFNCLPVPTAPPSNDLCSGATVISTLPFDSGNVLSFLATNDADVGCNSTTATAAQQGVWFSWTATPACSALTLAETSALDTATTIFTGTCGGTLTEVACSDPETFNFTGVVGTQYYILVSRWAATALGSFDAYRLTADCFVPPPNDLCDNVLPITVGQTVTGNLLNATGAQVGSCIGNSKDVWYSFTASVGGTFTFTGTVPSGDTGFVALVAWSDCSLATELACSNPGAGTSTVITVTLATGQSMVLRVSRFADSTFNGAAPFSVAMTGPAQVSNVTCCRGTTCSLTLAASCTAPAGVGVSLPSGSTTCNATGTNVSPCCFADYDKNGSRTVDDIFIYINAWFGVASNPYCKIGGNGVDAANIDDIFIFLNVWFAGGCG